MLKSGIPLEGALRQLVGGMRRGSLKSELEKLEISLREGVPLASALKMRQLPELYVTALRAGAEAGSVPEVLILLGDYYLLLQNITNRLKGLMVYPLLVLAASIGLSLLLSWLFLSFLREPEFFAMGSPSAWVGPAGFIFWVPPILLSGLLVGLLVALSMPAVRRWLRWHFPGMRETALEQTAAIFALLLSSGTRLDTAFRLVEALEQNSRAAQDIAGWRAALEQGKARFADMAVVQRVFPPLFVWLVAQGGDDLAAGFRRAAEIYHARAQSRTDLILYAALPLAVVMLGVFIMGQAISAVGFLARLIDSFG